MEKMEKIKEVAESKEPDQQQPTKKNTAMSLDDSTPTPLQNGSVPEMSVGELPDGHSRDNNQSAIQAVGDIMCTEKGCEGGIVLEEVSGVVDFHAELHAFSQKTDNKTEDTDRWCDAVADDSESENDVI